MSWYDGTVWVEDQGTQLVALLGQAFPTGAQVLDLLQRIGRAELNPVGGPLPAKLAWMQVCRSLTDDGALYLLVATVSEERPALKAQIAAIGETATVVSTGDPFQVLLIGPAKRPMVDREELRSEFRRFVDERFPVLLVTGKERSGKTHSRELIRHVLTTRPGFDLRQVDFSSPSSGNDGSALLSLMCRRLALEDVTAHTSRTTATRHAVDLVDDFVGVYRPPSEGQRVIVVDGLNRKNLKADVKKVAAKLITETAEGNLPRSQLVMAGYQGRVDARVRADVRQETTRPITRTHVRLFLESLCQELGRPLGAERVTSIVSTVMTGRPPLDVVADRVRAEALKLVEQP